MAQCQTVDDDRQVLLYVLRISVVRAGECQRNVTSGWQANWREAGFGRIISYRVYWIQEAELYRED